MMKFVNPGVGLVLYNNAAMDAMRMAQHQALFDPTKDTWKAHKDWLRTQMTSSIINSSYSSFNNSNDPWNRPNSFSLLDRFNNF